MFGCIVTAAALMFLTKKYPYDNTKDGRHEEQVVAARDEDEDALSRW